MSDEHKKRVEAAMMKHHQSLLPKAPRAKSTDPEKKFAHELLKHLRTIGFNIDVVDSSTFNKQAGYHTQNVTTAGFSDLVGCDNEGRAIYIEVKAPGKRNTLRPAQRVFLTAKINSNAFAIVCDSLASFDQQWSQYLMIVDRKKYLLDQLPKLSAEEKRRDDSNLSFDD